MEIRKLDKKVYKGKKFTAHYKTNGYYDVIISDDEYKFNYVTFDKTVDKSFDDEFFGEWLEDPIAYGTFENGKLIGYVEGSIESWNNRFRISNICVFDETYRNSGIGTKLIHAIEEVAISLKVRMIVLETQTCNEKAIAFYRKNGYVVIGFDLYSYSNHDLEDHEVRIEMGKKVKN